VIAENEDLFSKGVRAEECLDGPDTQPLVIVGLTFTQLPALAQSLRPNPDQFLLFHYF